MLRIGFAEGGLLLARSLNMGCIFSVAQATEPVFVALIVVRLNYHGVFID
jgi:hypothetical protein